MRIFLLVYPCGNPALRIQRYLPLPVQCDKITVSDKKTVYNKITIKKKEDAEMSVYVINNENFENEVLKSERRVLVDFYADWCGPCRMVAPVLREIAEEYPEYKICKVNVDDEPELAEAFQIMNIPALVVIENGKIIDRAVGAKPKAQLLELLGE